MLLETVLARNMRVKVFHKPLEVLRVPLVTILGARSAIENLLKSTKLWRRLRALLVTILAREMRSNFFLKSTKIRRCCECR